MAGAAQQQDGDPITDINVTPLVDVSLVLVIIFMAIAPFAMQSGIKVLESKAKAAVGKVSASENVSVRLTKDIRYPLQSMIPSNAAGWAPLRARRPSCDAYERTAFSLTASSPR